jgi:GNAT superfamily N-acetyltransferase
MSAVFLSEAAYLECVATIQIATTVRQEPSLRWMSLVVEGSGSFVAREWTAGAQTSSNRIHRANAASPSRVALLDRPAAHPAATRALDRVALLLDPASRAEAPRSEDRGTERIEWRTGALPAPAGIDPEAWSEYGFSEALETLLLHAADRGVLGYGSLRSFCAGVLEAGLYVERAWRGQGYGHRIASALFERLRTQGNLCHWVTLVQNAASQRLGRICPVRYEARITAFEEL